MVTLCSDYEVLAMLGWLLEDEVISPRFCTGLFSGAPWGVKQMLVHAGNYSWHLVLL